MGRSGRLNEEQSETSAVSVAAHLPQLSFKYHRHQITTLEGLNEGTKLTFESGGLPGCH